MTGTADRLVHMANQIAQAFASQRAEAAATATFDHLRLYWDPRMRRMIVERLATGGDGLTPVARAAVGRLAESQAASRG